MSSDASRAGTDQVGLISTVASRLEKVGVLRARVPTTTFICIVGRSFSITESV